MFDYDTFNDDFLGMAKINVSNLKKFHKENDSSNLNNEFLIYGKSPNNPYEIVKPLWVKLNWGKYINILFK